MTFGREKMIRTSTQKAYELIKEKIITTQMRPGSVIQEANLISELKLGRTPIREALKRLEAEKLVVISPRRGIFVTDVTLSDLSHIQEIRMALDLLCVRLVVERITAAELTEMKHLVVEYHAVNKSDQIALMTLDRCFHQLLAKGSHNKFLEAEIDLFYNLSMRIWHLYLARLDPSDIDMEAFVEIMGAIETKDVERAEQALLGHIRRFGDSIKQLL